MILNGCNQTFPQKALVKRLARTTQLFCGITEKAFLWQQEFL
jgi:hypothetical protein